VHQCRPSTLSIGRSLEDLTWSKSSSLIAFDLCPSGMLDMTTRLFLNHFDSWNAPFAQAMRLWAKGSASASVGQDFKQSSVYKFWRMVFGTEGSKCAWCFKSIWILKSLFLLSRIIKGNPSNSFTGHLQTTKALP